VPDDVLSARSLPPGALVVLYDGLCGFCNGVIQFLLPRDRGRRLWYAPLQSAFAEEILARHGRTVSSGDTMYLVSGTGLPQERLSWKSDAVLTLAGVLGRPWSLVRVLRVLPRPVRDAAYDVVALLRYRLFGKHQSCPLPRPEWRQRFIAGGG
jgi:predicted DCC family thiol-disulfide oxidoreductase YuxK